MTPGEITLLMVLFVLVLGVALYRDITKGQGR